MCHEGLTSENQPARIAHAIARHGNERMSQQVLLQYGGQAVDLLMTSEPEEMRQLFLTSYGVAGGLGSLAFSRNQETEADKLGLVFMAMAGYNPQEAVGSNAYLFSGAYLYDPI